jgi:CBS domain-containing protein
MDDEAIRTKKNPVRRRLVIDGASDCEADYSVYCPSRGRAESLETCAACKHVWRMPVDPAIFDAMVECVPAEPKEASPPRRMDMQEAAMRAPLRDVMQREVLCVRGDASVESIRALLLERGLRCVPVVDEERKLVGIVAKTDLLRDDDSRGDLDESGPLPPVEPGFHVEELATRVAADVMSPHVHALPEEAPLAFAISLMALEEVSEVPVVAADGQVVGVLTAHDVMKWMAEQLGYVFPR